MGAKGEIKTRGIKNKIQQEPLVNQKTGLYFAARFL